MKKSTIILTGIALALGIGAAHAQTTVVTETRLTPRPYADANIVDYRMFDINGDGTLTREEVGQKLFYVFDTDGNQLIDNIEWSKPMVITFAPMEKQVIHYVDYNGDGLTDQTTVTRQMFLERTGLSRFDKTGNGLSARDFLNEAFKKADRDWSGQIDIKEWQQAYDASLRPLPQNDTFRYND